MLKFWPIVPGLFAVLAGVQPLRAADLGFSGPDPIDRSPPAVVYAPMPASAPCEVGDFPRSPVNGQPVPVLYNRPASCLGFPEPGFYLQSLPNVHASRLRGAYPSR